MLNLTLVRPIREARSWGYEVRYGPFHLEDTVAHGDGTKPVTVLGRAEDVGVCYVVAEHRWKTGMGRRLLVSAWASFPVDIRDKADVRRKAIWTGRILRRLIAQKRERYLREFEP